MPPEVMYTLPALNQSRDVNIRRGRVNFHMRARLKAEGLKTK